VENIEKVLEAQARAFEDLKSTNEQRLKAIEAGSGRVSELEAKLKRINEDMDKMAVELRGMVAASNRVGAGEGSADDLEAREAIVAYLRKGDTSKLAAKGMSASVDADGGYMLPPSVVGRIITRIQELSPIRQIADVQQVGGGSISGVVDYGAAEVEWPGDDVTESDDTDAGELKAYNIPVHLAQAAPQISTVLAEDGMYDIEAWLLGKMGRAFGIAGGAKFVNGDGNGKPRGFATYTTVATADGSRTWGQLEHVATGTNGSFGTAPNGSDKLIALVHSLKADYRSGARFVMNKTTLGAARTLKANGSYIWLPSLDQAGASTLLGYGVTEAEDMPTYTTTDALAIAFGNFKAGYLIPERRAFSVLRNPYRKNGKIVFDCSARFGGGVVDFDAIKFLKFGTS
jgi:hypothetical protein